MRHLTLLEKTRKASNHSCLFFVSCQISCVFLSDSFVFVHLCDAVKKMHTPDYRNYLRLWNQEAKTKLENMKDLPKLNQVHLPC